MSHPLGNDSNLSTLELAYSTTLLVPDPHAAHRGGTTPLIFYFKREMRDRREYNLENC